MREAIFQEFHRYIPELKRQLEVSGFLQATFRYWC
jgi:hypothetical protein